MMNRKFITNSLAIGSLVMVIGCGASQQSTPKVSMNSVEKNSITTGSGGGFAGQFSGSVITHSGDIFSWHSSTGSPDSLELKFHTAPDSVAFFFRYLDEIGFNDLSFHSSGNINSFIERVSADTKHHVQWATDGGVSAPPEISTFFSLLSNYVRRHITK